MSELQSTIDEIRFLLQAEVVELTDGFQELAAEYDRVSREANERLRKCEDFLRRGLRSEALHLCEATPNLLDVVAQLDFPERPQWLDALRMYFLPEPQPLLFDVAGALNEAYAIQEPLKRLLDTHRLLALARSPLPQRLGVLRKLAELDSDSGHWDDDVHEMESVRLLELSTESRRAAAEGKSDLLNSLAAEAASPHWRQPVPASLVKELKQRAAQMGRAGARERLAGVGEELHAAFAALDLTRARDLRDTWNTQFGLAQLPASDPLVEGAQPVLEWIADQDREEAAERSYQLAVAALERGLDKQDLALQDAVDLRHAVEKAGRGVPEPLRTRVRNRISALELADTRRHQVLIGGGVGLTLAIAALVAFIAYMMSEADKTRKIVAAVEAHVTDANFAEARRLLDEHGSRMTSEAGLAVQRQLAEAEKSDHERQTQWKSALETARSAQTPAAAETPLQQARELARSAEEKAAVVTLEQRWKQVRDAELAGREDTFRDTLKSAASDLQRLGELLAGGASASEVEPLMDQLNQDLSGLRAQSPSVAPELGSQAALLDSRRLATQKSYAALKRRATLLDKITDATLMLPSDTRSADKRQSYRTALTQYIEAEPADRMAAGFKAAIEGDPLGAVQAKQQLVRSWKQLLPGDAAEMQQRLEQCAKYAEENPAAPDLPAVRRYQELLQSVRRREQGDERSEEGLKRRLVELFSSPLIKDGHMVRTREGACYYLPERADFSSRKLVSLKYLSGFNGEVRSLTFKAEDLATLKSESPPQTKISKRVRDGATKIPLAEWDKYFDELSSSLLEAGDIDPFLRYFLLVRTLEIAGLGNQLLEGELAPTLAVLNDEQLDLSVAWMDPTDEAARNARERAGVLLADLKDLPACWDKARVLERQLKRELLNPVWSVGWLQLGPRGDWLCQTRWTPNREHLLLVASHPPEAGGRSWRQIGRISGTSVSLQIPSGLDLPDGWLVFATARPADAEQAASR